MSPPAWECKKKREGEFSQLALSLRINALNLICNNKKIEKHSLFFDKIIKPFPEFQIYKEKIGNDILLDTICHSDDRREEESR